MPLKVPVVLGPEENLLQVLSKFQEGMCHLGVVSPRPEEAERALLAGEPIPADARPTGFLSLEDVIEHLLKEEMYDEVDAERERWLTRGHDNDDNDTDNHNNNKHNINDNIILVTLLQLALIVIVTIIAITLILTLVTTGGSCPRFGTRNFSSSTLGGRRSYY